MGGDEWLFTLAYASNKKEEEKVVGRVEKACQHCGLWIVGKRGLQRHYECFWKNGRETCILRKMWSF